MSEAVVSKKTYLVVWASLLALLALTVGMAYIHLGWLNPVVAVTIASMKALIIIMFFMHARYSPRLVWIVAGAAFLWLGILFMTFGDYITRQFMPSPTIWLR